MSNPNYVAKPSIDEVLTPKPDARPRIYAYAIADAAHHGQTTRSGNPVLQTTSGTLPFCQYVKKYIFVYKMRYGGRKNS